MKAAVKRAALKPADAEEQLQSFIDKFDPENQALIRSVRKALRKRFPGANELVYDNYNFFVIGFSPTERPTDAIASLACNANGAGLAFPLLRDQTAGSAQIAAGIRKQQPVIHLESAATLARPEVAELINAAIAICKPLPGGRGRVIIRAVSAKQRPRRK